MAVFANKLINMAVCSHCLKPSSFRLTGFCFHSSGTGSTFLTFEKNTFINLHQQRKTPPCRWSRGMKQRQSLPEALSSSGCGTARLCGPGEPCGAPTCNRKACHYTPPSLQDQMLMTVFPLKRRSSLFMYSIFDALRGQNSPLLSSVFQHLRWLLINLVEVCLTDCIAGWHCGEKKTKKILLCQTTQYYVKV